jgi:hypothetical protein
MSSGIVNLKDMGACECGEPTCNEYGTYRRGGVAGKRCVTKCEKCVRCRNRGNRKGGLGHQKKEAKALGVARKNSLGFGNEETAGIELEWEAKSGGEARPVFTAFNKHAKQLRARRGIGRQQRPELITYSMAGEPYSLRVYRSDQELDFVYSRACALGLIEG